MTGYVKQNPPDENAMQSAIYILYVKDRKQLLEGRTTFVLSILKVTF